MSLRHPVAHFLQTQGSFNGVYSSFLFRCWPLWKSTRWKWRVHLIECHTRFMQCNARLVECSARLINSRALLMQCTALLSVGVGYCGKYSWEMAVAFDRM